MRLLIKTLYKQHTCGNSPMRMKELLLLPKCKDVWGKENLWKIQMFRKSQKSSVSFGKKRNLKNAALNRVAKWNYL